MISGSSITHFLEVHPFMTKITSSLILWYYVVSTDDDDSEDDDDDDDDANDNDDDEEDIDDDEHPPRIPHACAPPARLSLWQWNMIDVIDW